MPKLNCYEVKRCGREPGGAMASTLGVCPAAMETRLNGVHGGRNAGRTCWIVAGTFCGGACQGTFASKISSCERCEFYTSVRTEEGPGFELSLVLLDRLR